MIPPPDQDDQQPWKSGLPQPPVNPESLKVEAKPGSRIPTSDTEVEPLVETARSRSRKSAADPTASASAKPGFFARTFHLFTAALLAIAATLMVAFTYQGYGHSWDEALYLKPGVTAAQWLQSIWTTGLAPAVTTESIDAAWGGPMEGPNHPEVAPVPKLAIGLGQLYLQPYADGDPLKPGRLPAAAAFGLTVGLLFLICASSLGFWGALATALCYMLMPRVFGHAHIAASETWLALSVLLVVAAWKIAMNHWRLGLILVPLAFGFAALTKVTVLGMPLALMLWGQWYRRRDYASAVFGMVFLAPLVILAGWPYLWPDPVNRLMEYLQFYTRHQSTAVWYMGRVWGYIHGAPAPSHYPISVLGASLPLLPALLMLIGLVGGLWRAPYRPTVILALVVGLYWLGLASLPGSPKYDGDRLFFPVWLTVAVLAGTGVATILFALDGRYRAGAGGWLTSQFTGFGVLAIVAGLGLWELKAWHPGHLNYFSPAVGGAKGAQSIGFESSYWGESVNDDVIEWIKTKGHATSGTRVRVLALNELAFKNLQDMGKLPADIDFAPRGAAPVDWYILQSREGFYGKLERALNSKPTEAEFGVGVPRIRIFRGNVLATDTPEPTTPPPPATTPATVPPPASSTAAPTTVSPAPTPAIVKSETVVPAPEPTATTTTATQTTATSTAAESAQPPTSNTTTATTSTPN